MKTSFKIKIASTLLGLLLCGYSLIIFLKYSDRNELIGKIKLQDSAAVKQLLDSSTDCNFIHYDNQNFILELASHFIHKRKHSSNSYSPLTLAISLRNPVIVRELLKHKANPNLRDDTGLTPLMVAMSSDVNEENLESTYSIALLLIDSGADPYLCDKSGEDALSMAINIGNDELVKRLFKENKLRQSTSKATSWGGEGLVYCASTGRLEIAIMLVSYGADVNYIDNSGICPLINAVLANDEKMVGFLVRSGAQVNKFDRDGLSPKSIARTMGNNTIMKLLNDAEKIK